MNKGLIKIRVFDKQVRTRESYEHASQNRARQPFELIKLKVYFKKKNE